MAPCRSADAAGVLPGSLTVNNSAVTYIFQTAGGTIGLAGSVNLVKTGTGTLTLTGLNTFTNGVSFNGEVVVNVGVAEGVGNGPMGNLTGTLLSFGGGTLQSSAANTTDYSSHFSTGSGQAIWLDANGQAVTCATALASATGTLTVGLVGGNATAR